MARAGLAARLLAELQTLTGPQAVLDMGQRPVVMPLMAGLAALPRGAGMGAMEPPRAAAVAVAVFIRVVLVHSFNPAVAVALGLR